MGFTYGALPGALNLAENAVEITVTPGNAQGLPTVVNLPPHARGLPIVNRTTTAAPGTGTNLWPELRPGEPSLTINGTIAAGAAPAVVLAAAGNPTLWVANALRNALLDAGIDVEGTAVDVDDAPAKPLGEPATVLYTHHSPPLAEIAKPLIKDSINLYAEAVMRLATGLAGLRTTDTGLDAVRLRLEGWGVPKEEIQIVDGSGLSRRDVIAPETLVAILRRFYDASKQSPWMQTLAVAGRDGSLENRMKGTAAEGNAMAKTGSMSNIRTIAGYVTTADGEPLVYAIMANNFEGRASDVTATIDNVLVRLAVFRREAATR
jgi:D-alanyl-D-alanine carboxypeptidase/D-alanyl-D-alanine-endopeptidase (penicillin-binding protein 4)